MSPLKQSASQPVSYTLNTYTNKFAGHAVITNSYLYILVYFIEFLYTMRQQNVHTHTKER